MQADAPTNLPKLAGGGGRTETENDAGPEIRSGGGGSSMAACGNGCRADVSATGNVLAAIPGDQALA